MLKYIISFFILNILLLNFISAQKKANSSVPDPSEFACIYTTEIPPLFSGCNIDSMSLAEKKNCSNWKFLKYIYKRFEWPRGFCGDGRVIVRFEIEKDGSTSNFDILRDIGGGVGERVLNIIKTMPKWTPGMKNGEPVKTVFNLPVRICLE